MLTLRSLVIWMLCLPLAIFLGYTLATPDDMGSFTVIVIVIGTLLSPLLLKYHHPLLVLSWNMSLIIFVLPGRPPLWMPLTLVTLVIATLQYAMKPEMKFIYVPSILWPLAALVLIVLITLRLTGGTGFQVLGSGVYGGRRYATLILAILGYFALTTRRIPLEKAGFYVFLFFMGGITMVVGDLAGIISPSFNFVFLMFPVENITALTNDVMGPTAIGRWFALSWMSVSVFAAMLSYYGLKGTLFDLKRPWRAIVLLTFMVVGLFGGFRSVLILFMLTMLIQFFAEGMMHAKYAIPAFLALVLGGVLVAGFSSDLPPMVQRSMAFLPIDIDPLIRMDAQVSIDWRIKMWQDMIPDIPKYLIVGKGYAINPNELEMTRFTPGLNSEASQLSSDFHNGPLSVLLAFGIFGSAAFLWFLVAAFRVLYANYRYGNPLLSRYNTFLLSFFLARVVFFLTIFGSLYSDMAYFTGLLGLSVSLNGGVAKKPAPVVAPETQPEPGSVELSQSPVYART
jgi:hypothetical protein